MRRALTALALVLSLPLVVTACLWDRDTPADEAKGMPEVVAILTGRFPRNPPLFHEVRLERVTAHLLTHPEDLAAYDDAGVACDRLGRGDEAVSWMEKKRARLDKLDTSRREVREHQYRYHANLGTFLAHRWIKRGGDRTKINEVKAARDEIASALKINPNAHFGREKYQLQVLDWIVTPPKMEGMPGMEVLPNLLGWSFDDLYGESTEPKEADDAVRGLAGLIVLGNAWESIDIFHALNVALQRDSVGYERGRNGGRNTLAYFAWLRCLELIDAGKGSIVPDAPKGQDLKSVLRRPDFPEADLLKSAFLDLRAEADAWQKARTAFMTERLKAGRHPDTDSNFWVGYQEQPAPSLPTQSVPAAVEARRALHVQLTLVLLICVPALLLALLVGWWFTARKQARSRKVPLGNVSPIDPLA